MTSMEEAEIQRLKAGLEQAKRKREHEAKQQRQMAAKTADQTESDDTKPRK